MLLPAYIAGRSIFAVMGRREYSALRCGLLLARQEISILGAFLLFLNKGEISACGPPSFARGGKGCKTPPRTKVLEISF